MLFFYHQKRQRTYTVQSCRGDLQLRLRQSRCVHFVPPLLCFQESCSVLRTAELPFIGRVPPPPTQIKFTLEEKQGWRGDKTNSQLHQPHPQPVAVTRDGIRFVRDRRQACWGMPCTDQGRSSKTVPFDKITDCDIEEPAGNTCLCILLSTVNIDTASSGSDGKRHELQISGLRDPHAFKELVWQMKRMRDVGASESAGRAVSALEMVDRDTTRNDGDVSMLLREIRDELRQKNALLQSIQPTADQPPVATQVSAVPSAPSDTELV